MTQRPAGCDHGSTTVTPPSLDADTVGGVTCRSKRATPTNESHAVARALPSPRTQLDSLRHRRICFIGVTGTTIHAQKTPPSPKTPRPSMLTKRTCAAAMGAARTAAGVVLAVALRLALPAAAADDEAAAAAAERTHRFTSAETGRPRRLRCSPPRRWRAVGLPCLFIHGVPVYLPAIARRIPPPWPHALHVIGRRHQRNSNTRTCVYPTLAPVRGEQSK